MQPTRLAQAVALMSEIPRFTPAQWQRLFSDAGLRDCKPHLFLRERDAYPNSPWAMVVDTARGLIDLQAFTVPLPAPLIDQAIGRDALLRVARSHRARIEVNAVLERCPREAAHELVARAAAGALRTTYALAWLHPASGLLHPAPSTSQRVRETPEGRFPLELYASVRETGRAPTVIIDTLGLAHFDVPDLEIEVDAEDATASREFLTDLATALVAGSRTLREQERVTGPLGLGWKASARRSTVSPHRVVMRLSLAG